MANAINTNESKTMTAAEFFNEWSTKYSDLKLSVRQVAASFPMTQHEATAMFQGFLKEGKVKAKFHKATRMTVYTLVK